MNVKLIKRLLHSSVKTVAGRHTNFII